VNDEEMVPEKDPEVAELYGMTGGDPAAQRRAVDQ